MLNFTRKDTEAKGSVGLAEAIRPPGSQGINTIQIFYLLYGAPCNPLQCNLRKAAIRRRGWSGVGEVISFCFPFVLILQSQK